MNTAMVKSEVKKLVPEGGWVKQDKPRITQLSNKEMGLPKRSLINIMLKVGTAYCPNLFRTMFRNFRIYFSFALFNSKMMPKGELTRRQTELAILRVAWKTRSRYEWGQHVDIGIRDGLTLEDISRVAMGGSAEGWSESEGAILMAVDELIDNNVISSEQWTVLSNYFNDRLLIELMLLIGGYTALAGVLNTVGIELEPEIEQTMTNSLVHS